VSRNINLRDTSSKHNFTAFLKHTKVSINFTRLLFLIFIFQCTYSFAQKPFGITAFYGSVLNSNTEYSRFDGYVKQRRSADITYGASLTYFHKKSSYHISYRSFTQVISFGVSGIPFFRAREGFTKVSHRVPINSFQAKYGYQIAAVKNCKFKVLAGLGMLVNQDGVLLGDITGAQQMKTIRGQNMTLTYTAYWGASGYFYIQNASIGLQCSRLLTRRSSINLTFGIEQDWKPLSANTFLYTITNDTSPLRITGDRDIFSGTNRMYLDLGYTYHFGKTTKTASTKQKKGKK
jgi:hypothetical protein